MTHLIPVREFSNGSDVLAFARARIAQKRAYERDLARRISIKGRPVIAAPVLPPKAMEVPVEWAASDTPQAPQKIPFRRKLALDIIHAVALDYGVSPRDIMSESRAKRLTFVRHVACYVATKVFMIGYAAFGRDLQRDHTSVLHGERKISALIQMDQSLADRIETISARIRVMRAAREATA